MVVAALRSRIVDRAPRLWVLWTASRPSQVALVLLVYVWGAGMGGGAETVGPPAGGVGGGSGSGATAGAVGWVDTGIGSRLLVGALALLPVTLAVHYANEYADVETDALTTRTPFSGGSGALAETGLPRSILRRATVASVGCAVVGGGAAVATAGLPLGAVGLLVAILLAGLAYSLPPVGLIGRGVGEAVNAALGGIALPLYGVAVVSAPTYADGLAVLPFALVVGCNLLATHWPDREADAAVGKRTLVVRWSPGRVRQAYAVLAGTGAAATTGLWTSGVLPGPVALAHLAPVPFLVWGWAVLTRQRSPLPSVLAMVVLAVASTVAWWWVGLGS